MKNILDSSCYLFDNTSQQVYIGNDSWDYYRIDNYTGHPRRYTWDSPNWYVFPSVDAAEQYVTGTLQRPLEEFHCQLISKD